MVDTTATPHGCKGGEKFFLVEGEDTRSAGDRFAEVPDFAGVLHLDLCAREGTAWLRKLWFEGAGSDGDSRRYAVAVHNGRFGDPPGCEDSDCSDRSPIGSSHKKRVRRLSSGSDDVPVGEHATGSQCPRRSARRRVPFDGATDRLSCNGGGSQTPISDSPQATADDGDLGATQVRRSQRLDEKQRRRSSPLAERLIRRKRDRVAQSDEDESDGSVGLAADGISARGKRRSIGRCDAGESDIESSEAHGDFLVESDELSGVEGDDEQPPRNPYMPSKEELDEYQKPAFVQLRAVTNRNRSQLDSFREYMKGMLRKVCAERSGSEHQLASSLTPDEEKAARKIRDDMIRSMKNNLNSAAWQREFKEALDTYETYRSEKVLYDGHLCDVCNRKERRATYVIRLSNPVISDSGSRSGEEDEQPEPHLAFYAGRRCANRSRGYHELQHYEKAAFRACCARVKAVAARAGGEGHRLVTAEQCLAGESGKEWLSLEFTCLQSQLQAAEKFMDKENADDDD